MNFKIKKYLLPFIALIMVAAIFSACNDEVITTDHSKSLSFSKDTITFDTVFTTIGSTTKKFVVYNKNNQALKIDNISLAGGSNSNFKINVDGSISADNHFSNVVINGHDSIFIFVQVTVDPNNSNSPILIDDSIMFQTNGNLQHVRLEAIGQDMVLFNNKIIHNDTTLNADKPYLIYGYLAIDSAKTLNIKAGAKLYFHNNASLIIYGNLRALGTFENPIEMRGDRLDNLNFDVPVPYKYVAGQWGGIFLYWKRGNHILRNVDISSAYVGLYMTNSDFNTLPQMQITNCKIQNFVYYGLMVQNGNVRVANSEISNTGSYTVYLSGGSHIFLQSTIANYYNSNPVAPTTRDKYPAFMIMGLYHEAPMKTIIKNCVIMGSSENEFSIASRYINQYNGTFTNSYIRRKTPYDSSPFSKITWYQQNDTVFKHPSYDYENDIYFDFTPDSISPLRGMADSLIAKQYPLDLNGNNRLEDKHPDAGAYEWEPTK